MLVILIASALVTVDSERAKLLDYTVAIVERPAWDWRDPFDPHFVDSDDPRPREPVPIVKVVAIKATATIYLGGQTVGLVERTLVDGLESKSIPRDGVVDLDLWFGNSWNYQGTNQFRLSQFTTEVTWPIERIVPTGVIRGFRIHHAGGVVEFRVSVSKDGNLRIWATQPTVPPIKLPDTGIVERP